MVTTDYVKNGRSMLQVGENAKGHRREAHTDWWRPGIYSACILNGLFIILVAGKGAGDQIICGNSMRNC